MRIENDYGVVAGDVCGRNGCAGIIDEHEKRGCSCHINPPCSACTEPRGYCPECGWDERNEIEVEDWQRMDVEVDIGRIEKHLFKRTLDSTKIDYVIKGHTHFSQICEGVYPLTATQDDVRKVVCGTFGGRFVYFCDGKFKYIAYTD